ncbi:MAG: DsbA family protein, partial [Sulfurimonadaceae bacterium]|nr:DsbA family protein [Sulfurimonadaceae bacterium]
VWDAPFRDFLRSHWNDVAARTGQPFDLSLLERERFDYTTEPACRAVCTGRELDETKVFALFERLQRAFYAEGRDITDDNTLCELAEETGYLPDDFKRLFLSNAMREQVVSDRYKSRAYGANAFPSLVQIDDEGHLSVIKGYRTYGDIVKMIDN